MNGTGGTTGSGFNGGGGSAAVAAAVRRAAAWGARAAAPSHAWNRRNQVKNGTYTSLVVSSCTCVVPGDESTIVAIRRALVSGIPTIGPANGRRRLRPSASSPTIASRTRSESDSTQISIERRTCGMLRRPRLEESS